MKRNEILATGVVTEKGGLSMYMGEVNRFFCEHKGERIIARFVVAPVASSAALKGYYYNYIVPMCKDGFRGIGERRTEKEVERFLRGLTPVCWEEIVDMESGRYEQRLKEIPELSNTELIEHIEVIRQFAAEELHIYIEDPKTL